MPSVEEHCKMSLKRTKGKNNFKDLHEWVDAPSAELGFNHRIERHVDNEIYRKYIRKRWGEKAVIEWLFHIAVDNLQTAYKASHEEYGENTYNYYRFALSKADKLYVDFGRLSGVEFIEKFNKEVD